VPKGENNKLDKITFNYLKNLDKNEDKNIEIIFKKEIIHSKVYLFKKQEKVLVSSMNMTFDSWSTLLESGYLTNKKNHFWKVLKFVESLKDDSINLNYLDIVESFEQPTISLNERPSNSNRIEIPWELAGDDPDWIFYKHNKERDYVFIKKEDKKDVNREKEPQKARGTLFKKEKKIFALLNQDILNYLKDESKSKNTRLEEAKRFLRRNKNWYDSDNIDFEEYKRNNEILFLIEKEIKNEF
jgi:hypothetical protein